MSPCGRHRASAECGSLVSTAIPSLHDGLEALREDRASDPAAVAAVARLAGEFGTPLYVYDKAAITGRFRALKDAFRPRFPKLRLHYALKANGNVALARILRAEGAFPEVVSLGEIETALRAGWSGEDVLFTSSSKTPAEIGKTIQVGAVLNADSRRRAGAGLGRRGPRRPDAPPLVPAQPGRRPRHAVPHQHGDPGVEVRGSSRGGPRARGVREGEGASGPRRHRRPLPHRIADRRHGRLRGDGREAAGLRGRAEGDARDHALLRRPRRRARRGVPGRRHRG